MTQHFGGRGRWITCQELNTSLANMEFYQTFKLTREGEMKEDTLALLPRLQFSGVTAVHCSHNHLSSCDPPTLASQ
ncbi:hypothetical protein AAY473_033916, partial [Plecturocebus cupreus]